MTPRVSALITTVDRSQLVVRALRSALAQTLGEVEVIVVIDGADPHVQRALGDIVDPRVRVHALPERSGQGAAINAGVALARAPWIALLDDDDSWMPEKLEHQLAITEAATCVNPVVACRFIARHETGDRVWPRRAPLAGEPVCEYLFCRRRLWFGEGIIPTSVIFTRTSLLRELPMAEDLERHCDIDWLVRSDARADVAVSIDTTTAPLAVWDVGEQRERMSNDHDWRYSRGWLASRRQAMTPRAYAGFLLTWASFSARCQRDRSAFLALLREAVRDGRPNPTELLVHCGLWTVPMGLRSRLGRAASGSVGGSPASALDRECVAR